MNRQNETFYFNSNHKNCSYELGIQLTELILNSKKPLRNIIILCIGTDRSTGDSLGPLVGYKIGALATNHLSIIGTLDNPAHATNLEKLMDIIRCEYENPFIIAVDASLGTTEHVGYVTLANGPLKPGLGVSKTLPLVGDIHITGIVNATGINNHILLQNTRLNMVMQLADAISRGLFYCLDPLRAILSFDATSPDANHHALSSRAYASMQQGRLK